MLSVQFWIMENILVYLFGDRQMHAHKKIIVMTQQGPAAL